MLTRLLVPLRLRAAVVAGIPLLGTGCAGIPADRGFDTVANTLAGRGIEVAAPAAPTRGTRDDLLAQLRDEPLDLELAQRIALAHNPRLLAGFADLGLAQADVYDAARLANPRFSVTWLDASGRSAQITLGLAQNLAELLTLTPRRRIAAGELGRVQQQAAAALMALSADVEAAWYRHLAALAARELKRAIADAGATSAEFAAAMYAAGNIPRLALDRERAAAETLALDSVRAETDVAATHAALSTLMGVGPELTWSATASLPLPVAAEDDAADLQALALAGRLDLLAAQRAVTVLEDALGLARSFRWLGSAEVGVEHERDPDGGRLTGPTAQFELPLFNQGAGRMARAQARLDGARANAAATALEVGNDVARLQAEVRAAREIVARLRERVLPLREHIVHGARRLHNYMLIGQFDVLQDKLAQYAAYEDYLAALGDYWVSRAQLARAVGAPLPSGGGEALVEPATLLGASPPPAPTDESLPHASARRTPR